LLQILGEKTWEVLNSEAWLSMPEHVVQDVLQMDRLDASELQVVAALLNWGRAQVAGDGDVEESSDDVKLRRKIAASLNVIRFAQFDSKQFMELCQGDLGRILNVEEKFKILECICLGDWKTMPVNLGPLSKTPRIRQTFSIVSSYTIKSTLSKVESRPFIDFATFEVGKDIKFLGIDVILSDFHLWPYSSIDVRDRDYPELPLVTLDKRYSINEDGTAHFKLDNMFILKRALVYRIYFTYSFVKIHTPFYYHRITGYSKYENENIVKVLGSYGNSFEIKKWHFKNIS
jgi:BTB And C-terminal Kelch